MKLPVALGWNMGRKDRDWQTGESDRHIMYVNNAFRVNNEQKHNANVLLIFHSENISKLVLLGIYFVSFWQCKKLNKSINWNEGTTL